MNARGERVKPAKRRPSWTHTIIAQGMKAHVTLGMYPEGNVCEIFVVIGKGGSPLRSLFEGWAKTASLSLQHGTPLRMIAKGIRSTTKAPVADESGKLIDCVLMWDAIAALLESADV